jgi:hypothetical protein
MSETKLLENYLLNRLQPADKLVMDARVLLDSELRDKATWQQNTYDLVKAYGRKCLRLEIEAVHKKIFTEKRFESFRRKITRIFEK